MKDFELEQFEAELEALRPAHPDPAALERLRSELSAKRAAGQALSPTSPAGPPNWTFLRWLIPGAIAACTLALGWITYRDSGRRTAPPVAVVAAPALKADKVEIDRQWVADFDAVARLPDGVPLRFRCEQWLDKVRVRDSATGLVLERTTPRLEIVPVSLETY